MCDDDDSFGGRGAQQEFLVAAFWTLVFSAVVVWLWFELLGWLAEQLRD